MKKYLVVFGIILVLVCSMVILTGCGSAQNSTNENKVEEKTEEKVEEKAAEVVLKDYSYKDLSFKLTSDYEKTDSTSSDTLIYNTDIEEGKMKMFSVGSFSAEGLSLDEADIADITSIVATFIMKHSNKKQKYKKCTQCTITRGRRYRIEFSPRIVKIVI